VWNIDKPSVSCGPTPVHPHACGEHPSGDPEPSEEDLKVNKGLVEAGKILGIDVIDHIISPDNFYSFKNNGL
jgi:DNA repair protein RadC